MNTFAAPNWESNLFADKACKQLFTKNTVLPSNKLRKKIKTKTKIKNKKLATDSIKNNNKRILKNKSNKSKFNKKTNEEDTLNHVVISSKQVVNNKSLKKTIESNKNKHITINKKSQKKLTIEKNRRQTVTQSNPICKKKNLNLREKMLEKLKAARFRYINEQIYINTGQEAKKYFNNDPDAFKAYHEGYRQQIKQWNLNPLDVIIKSIKKMPKNYEIADFGCGDGRLSKSVEQKVHSFDLVAVNESVTACDMANVPLESNKVDVVVFCLSLMGTNLKDYVAEANRVLKIGGLLKIVEVESRFETVDAFVKGVERYGFVKVWKDLSQNLFYFLDFKKNKDIKNKSKLPSINLQPCLYKKR